MALWWRETKIQTKITSITHCELFVASKSGTAAKLVSLPYLLLPIWPSTCSQKQICLNGGQKKRTWSDSLQKEIVSNVAFLKHQLPQERWIAAIVDCWCQRDSKVYVKCANALVGCRMDQQTGRKKKALPCNWSLGVKVDCTLDRVSPAGWSCNGS